MSSYRVSVSNNNVKVDTSTVKHETKVNSLDYSASLSRVGGQGSKGDSVTSVETVNGEIIFTITRGDGTTYETNIGSAADAFNFDGLGDVSITTPSEGDVVLYDATASEWKNHQLTTSKVLDVDNTNKEDGAVLVYDNTAQKYQATNRIEKQTTHIIGGSF